MNSYDKALRLRNKIWHNLKTKDYKSSYESILINRLYRLDVLCNQLAFSNLKGVNHG